MLFKATFKTEGKYSNTESLDNCVKLILLKMVKS